MYLSIYLCQRKREGKRKDPREREEKPREGGRNRGRDCQKLGIRGVIFLVRCYISYCDYELKFQLPFLGCMFESVCIRMCAYEDCLANCMWSTELLLEPLLLKSSMALTEDDLFYVVGCVLIIHFNSKYLK